MMSTVIKWWGLVVVSVVGLGLILQTQAAPKVVVVSLDGNAHWFAEELQKKNIAPKYSVLLKKYGFTDPTRIVPNFPSKTAPGHATLFTGVYADQHGVTGNSVFKLPLKDHGVLSNQSGFSRSSLLVPLLWEITAKEKVKTIVYQGTHSVPMQVPKGGEAYLTLVDGYNGVASGDGVISARGRGVSELSIHKRSFYVRGVAADRIEFSQSRDFSSQQTLTQGFANRIHVAFEIDKKIHKFYLAWVGGSLDEGGAQFYYSQLSRRIIFPERLADRMAMDVPSFVPNAASGDYRNQKLGPHLEVGGDGKAEALYIDSVIAAIDHMQAANEWVQDQQGRGDLEVYYLPFPDEVLHMWAGYLMTDSPRYDVKKSEIYWKQMGRLFDRIADFIEASVYAKGARPDDVFLVTDHGMDYVDKSLYLNQALSNAGLLTWGAKGNIDLKSTRALYPAAGGYFVKLNLDRYQGGIVPDGERNRSTEELMRALSQIADPTTGKSIITKVWKATEMKTFGATAGERGGEVYFEVDRGWTLSARQSRSLTSSRGHQSTGTHGFVPTRPEMSGAFLSQKGARPLKLKTSHLQTEIFPTILKKLGLGTPAYVQAKPIDY